MSRQQHLMPPAQRRERTAEKRRLILRFLREEIWSDANNFGELLQVKPAATYRTLSALVDDEVLRSTRVPIVGGQVTLWGINAHGQALAAENGEPVHEKVFVPSRVSATFLRHSLDLQWLRIRAERDGWNNWINADRVEKWTEGKARPDAFAMDKFDHKVAIECERTIKSPKRYNQILNAWLQAIRRGDVQKVVWVSPNVMVRDRLKQIITNMTHVEVAGQQVLIPRDRFLNLDFLTYAEWPKT